MWPCLLSREKPAKYRSLEASGDTPLGESKWGNPGPTSQGEEELLRVKGQIMCPAAYMEPSIEHTQSQISPQNTVLTLLKDAKKGLAETPEMTPEKQVWLTDYKNVPSLYYFLYQYPCNVTLHPPPSRSEVCSLTLSIWTGPVTCFN